MDFAHPAKPAENGDGAKESLPGGGEQRNDEPKGDVEIPRAEWLSFLDGFSRQHLHWMATIEAITQRGTVTVVEERPLEGVSIDHAGVPVRVYLQMGATAGEEMTHVIHDPLRIWLRQSASGEHRGMAILSADGCTTELRFRAQVRPELLDGI